MMNRDEPETRALVADGHFVKKMLKQSGMRTEHLAG
jgi:hypothetical protein